jgi:hypothetical protein
MRYFTRFGLLLPSYLMVAIAMEGNGLHPLLNFLNSASEIISQVGIEDNTSNSSLYALSQISLSSEYNL